MVGGHPSVSLWPRVVTSQCCGVACRVCSCTERPRFPSSVPAREAVGLDHPKFMTAEHATIQITRPVIKTHHQALKKLSFRFDRQVDLVDDGSCAVERLGFWTSVAVVGRHVSTKWKLVELMQVEHECAIPARMTPCIPLCVEIRQEDCCLTSFGRQIFADSCAEGQDSYKWHQPLFG